MLGRGPGATGHCDAVNRNVWILLIVSAFFGLAFGVYELALPFYLRSKGISMTHMGVIFAVPVLCTFVIRIGFGSLSDHFRRKPFYAGALALCTAACAATPMTALVWAQVMLKCVRESAVELRKTLHSVLLYEAGEGTFIDNIGKTNGTEFLLMAVGSVAAGYWLSTGTTASAAAEDSVFWLCAGMLAVCVAVFALIFSEDRAGRTPPKRSALREIMAADLDPRLVLMTAAIFVFNIGLSVSHSQVPPLFFQDKFAFGKDGIAWIMAGHRVTIGLPLLVVGQVVRRPIKWLYVTFVLVEGVILSASGMISIPWLATSVWLLHDLIGAGIWLPTQTTLMQQFAKPESRGAEVSKVMAISSLGFVIGPPLAGALYEQSVSLPFIVGGVFMFISGLVLIPLRVDAAAPGPAAPATKP